MKGQLTAARKSGQNIANSYVGYQAQPHGENWLEKSQQIFYHIGSEFSLFRLKRNYNSQEGNHLFWACPKVSPLCCKIDTEVATINGTNYFHLG